ncbi:MAG: D-alanine--D-alanine ligase [Gemmatimonadaceae bacterium]
MTRIGFAYNQKPDAVSTTLGQTLGESVDAPAGDEEPPSRAGAPSAIDASAAAAAASDDEFAEWDGPETIAAVESALAELGEVVRLEATPDFPERLRAERPDIVFNMAEGLRGVNREAHVPAILEFFGTPYSGSDPFTLSLSLDKARTKEWLTCHGIPNAPFVLVREGDDPDALAERVRARGLRFPLFAKPVHEGSSKGITERNFCGSPGELRHAVAFLLESYAQPVLVEEFLPGREFTCAVLGNGDAARVLPIVGMNFGALPAGALPIYGFEAKWLWDRPENPLEIFECPARVDGRLLGAIERVTLGAYHALGCRDWSRVDVRLDAAGAPHVVEVNPLPGILPDPADNSCFPKAARAAGMSYDELIQSCLLLAAERQGVAITATAAARKARAALAAA